MTKSYDSYSQGSLLCFPYENHMQVSVGLVPSETYQSSLHGKLFLFSFLFSFQKLELAESWNSRSLKNFTHSIKLYALEMLSDKFP